MAEQSPGRIITFYSYKGGVGRSMTLANVAWILASNGKRVLVIDWDLEAPGLHRYYMPFLPDPDLRASDGLIDFVLDYASEVMTPPAAAAGGNGDWYSAQANLLPYAASLDWRFPGGGTLDFVGAGRQGTSYSTRVNTFDWGNFYNRLDGGRFLEEVKRQLRQQYDFILIDSRTGASDTSGICTVQMPDTLVICFTLNNQSIDGAAVVANSAFNQRGRSGLEVYPVPMRIDLYEKDKLAAGRAYARQRLGLFPEHLDRQQYWGQVELLYVPYYSYEEVLATFGDEPGESNTLLAWTERLTGYLTGGEVQRSARIPAQDRQAALRLYLRRGATDEQQDSRVNLAEQVYSALTREGQEAARLVFTRLVRIGPTAAEDEPARVPLRDLATTQNVPQAFASAGVLRIDVSSGEEVVQLPDATLLREWGRLREWIDGDRSFLIWRQSLDALQQAWEEHRGARSGLLRSRLLRDALAVRERRRESLNEKELRYIAASARARMWNLAGIAGSVLLLVGLVVAGTVVNADARRRIANEQRRIAAEERVIEYKSEITSLRAEAEADDPGSWSLVRQEGRRLAYLINSVSSADLSTARRIIQHEYGGWALLMVARAFERGSEPERERKKQEIAYATQAIEEFDVALSIMGDVARSTLDNKDSATINDWITGESEDLNRTHYLKAIALATAAHAGGSSTSETVREELAQIRPEYLKRYPPEKNPALSWTLKEPVGAREASRPNPGTVGPP